MSAQDRHGDLHSLAAIDWWPGKMRLSHIARRSLIRVAHVEALQQGVTLYRDFTHKSPAWERECGDWLFDSVINLPSPGESMMFLWAPPLQPPEGTPEGTFHQELISEVITTEEYAWPPILWDLNMIVDRGAQSNGLNVSLTAAVDRGLWRDGANVPCTTVKREYVSSMRPPAEVAEVNVPMPTPIRGDFYGQPIRIPSCLHPRVELTSLNSDSALVQDCTPTRTSQRSGTKMVFGATNYQTWEPHICVNKVTQDGALWRRMEVTVYPPPMPTLTYL